MKFKSLALSGALALMVGLTVVGCNENPVSTPSTPNVSLLEATSMSSSSIGLRWTKVSSANSYVVSWEGLDDNTKGSIPNIAATDSMAQVTGLTVLQAYKFTVRTVVGVDTSAGATVTWAPADRKTAEPDGVTKIRMYEKLSAKGSAITLDPPDGPSNVSVAASNPNLGKVQIAMYYDTTTNTINIGPAYAFDSSVYRNVEKFDHNVYTGKTSFVANSLNDWYYSQSIDNYIESDGNFRKFSLPNDIANGGYGFFVRTGTAGNYHYARIFVKNSGGHIFQGTPDNRYVELEISYQTKPNLAYAKGAPVRNSPIGVYSTVRPH